MRIIILLLTLFAILPCTPQGIPPLQNFNPSQYRAENQNWDISQGSDKIIYVANSEGLLSYNGAEWQLYPLPNESIVRSVKVSGTRIYTGGYREFGFWQRNNRGVLEYTSLSQRIKTELLPDEEFWNILRLEGYMVFHSLERLYTFNLGDETINWVDTQSSFPGVFQLGPSVFFQRPGEGVYAIEGGKAVLKYDFQLLKEAEVIQMFARDTDILIFTRQKGVFVIEKEEIRPWQGEVNSELTQISLYTAIALKEGGYALGTISDGLILLDGSGNIQCRLDKTRGLQNNTVLSLFEDQRGTLWLGLDNGISYLNLKSPYRIYRNSGGDIGSVYATMEFKGVLYIGTNQGLYYKTSESEDSFVMIPGTNGQVWSLEVIYDTLFCGHHSGTFVVEGRSARKVPSTSGTWNVKPIPGAEDLLLQGSYTGLNVLERRDGKWQVRNKIKGFENSSRYVEFFREEIFVNHEYKGLFRLILDPDLTRAVKISVDTLYRGANSGLARYGDDLLFASREGVFRFDPSVDALTKDTVLSLAMEEGGYISGKMVPLNKKDLWIFTEDQINVASPGNLDNRPVVRTVPINNSERKGIHGYENVYGPDQAGRYILGSNNGFFSVDLDIVPEHDVRVEINRITLSANTGGRWVSSLLDFGEEATLSNKENNLTFHFYIPEYSAMEKPRYQYRLAGIYEDWSSWTGASSVSFSNLPHGSYHFEVRGMLGNQISSNTARYSFTIAKPWYITNTAIVVYLLLFLFGVIGIHWAYRRYYRIRQEEIIARNKKELALARARSEKEIIDLKNKQLKEEFRNKSNELAASTLSIIKKNELLVQIKEQLLTEAPKETSSNQLIKIIDKNLNRTDDWELFKEAFNNADREFLQKLKKKHPNLSPNDIKVCAYLRLNLTSKEIAPLLNISTRSVEIKRYRLRKKMHLDHDANLTEYILTL